eukprot:CAMPEP_0119203272 /NCGR_PEP_ID=MMETSP1316-20130426/34194_1 /TAXON_ID=41880 /ORGANISM="Pycnococcus provasolii, Strain RCC2336" /LENGTH=92 /DNA_ID=CAMNT_0007199509 /DNA_START=78 /DNA_END=352 /DNA_ORIENTATION=+
MTALNGSHAPTLLTYSGNQRSRARTKGCDSPRAAAMYTTNARHQNGVKSVKSSTRLVAVYANRFPSSGPPPTSCVAAVSSQWKKKCDATPSA